MLSADKILERRLVAPGEKIFTEGDEGEGAYLVEAGRIALYKHVDGKKVHLATLVKGAMFGEMAVIDGAPRMASAVSMERGVLVVIPRKLVQQKLSGLDPFAKALVSILIENLRNVHKVYMTRPRTIEDFALILKDLLVLQNQYTNAVGIDEYSPEIAKHIEVLCQLIDDQLKLREKLPRDRRQGMIPDLAALPD